MVSVVAIFDIGKTNKKFFLFNEDYKIVEASSINLEEIVDEDGFVCEDIDALSKWVISTFKKYLHNNTYDVKALNFSAYGASFVHLNRNGGVVTPLYNYLKPFSKKTEEDFYRDYGTKEEISLNTASPALGNLNSGLQLYALKHDRQKVYDLINVSLHLPQYLSYLITQKKYSDITSIGCHTALWDFEKNNYHHWVIAEDIDKKLAPLLSSQKVVDIFYEGKCLKCGIGLHDSSAAFIPYIQNINEPFLLISTGTWCISMNAFNKAPLTLSELEQDCLCYMTYEGESVKAARLFAGYEHEIVTKKMAQLFRSTPDYFDKIAYDEDIPIEKFELEALGEFDPSRYETYEIAYINFMAQLVKAQKKSTDLIMTSDIRKIFVDGGFAKNEIFMQLLANAFPNLEVYAASVSQATAVGAAMAIHKVWNHLNLPDNIITARRFFSNR